MRRPSDLGLPARFTEWRPHQKDAVLTIASAGDGYDALNAPTGSGKTCIYMSVGALMGEGRTVILTKTKSLQDQIAREFPSVIDIRGQNNYLCNLELPAHVSVDEAMCHLGMQCHLKGGGCDYFDRYRRAIRAPVVVTNYSYWLSIHEYAEGLGGFDFLVCDEAHEALDELGNHMSAHFGEREIDAFLTKSRPGGTKQTWRPWAEEQLRNLEPKLQMEMDDLRRRGPSRSLLRRIYELKRVVKKLNDVCNISKSDDRWVFEGDNGLRWTPVWPSRGAGDLFRGIRKVLLVSATLTPKSLKLLGAPPDFRYIEYPSTFPVKNRPIIHLTTGVRLRYDTDRAGLRQWLDKIDQIIQFRRDRKGIIHAVSYDRARYILDNSRYRGYMVAHGRRDARQKVEEFKRMKPPAILVSPSVDTGVDFPYEQAEYQIIAKIPFLPTGQSPVLTERAKDDKEYSDHVTMNTIVQMAGRGCRAADDRCQTLIVDDQASWFLRRNRRFAPKWFLDALELDVSVTPKPLDKLRR